MQKVVNMFSELTATQTGKMKTLDGKRKKGITTLFKWHISSIPPLTAYPKILTSTKCQIFDI